jgi:flagellin-like hook-associated protein FlgL
VGDINTKFQGVYLFAGSVATTPPYEIAGNVASAYQGDSEPTGIEILPGRTVATTYDGSALMQGSDPQHVLDVLTDLATAISAGDETAVTSGIDALNRAFDRATAVQARIGQDIRLAEESLLLSSTRRVGTLARISSLEDADLAEATAKLAQSETAYRAALSAMASIGRLSLMDYL